MKVEGRRLLETNGSPCKAMQVREYRPISAKERAAVTFAKFE